MKKIIFKYFIINVLSFSLISCEKVLIGTEPSLPELSFESFWQDMDKNFSFFAYRNIDWDSVYHVHRPTINAQTTDDELAKVFNAMLSKFKVGHLFIADIKTRKTIADGLPNVDSRTYLGGRNTSSVSQYIDSPQFIKTTIVRRGEVTLFTFGGVKGTDWGYIDIDNMFGQRADYEKIDDILVILKDKKGIIIDVRNNGGGDSNNGALVAGRFFKETQFIGYRKFKNGVNRNDFTDWQRLEYPKVGRESYQGKVILLTSRLVGSAAETFVKIMRGLPNVTSVGDTTWGSIGNRPVYKTLPNGWFYSFPTAVEVDKNKQSNEGIGFAPAIFVLNTPQSIAAGKDLMLEKAIEVLKNK